MNGKMPNSRRNLDIAINRMLKNETNPLQIRIVLANTIIGQLLPKGAVKGGSALKFRYGDKSTRFTRDLDMARTEEWEAFLENFDAALDIGWNGFTGRIVRKEPAKPKGVPNEYIMQPFEIKLAYNGKSWMTVLLEVGHTEIGDTSNPDYYISEDIVTLFVKLGFPAPKPVALMQTHHQIAQKLHALSAENSERAHDLIDLQVIVKNETVDLAQTRNTCMRLFDSRKMQVWPPIISIGENWNTLYDAQRFGLDVIDTVDEAITWANDFVQMIEQAAP
jgi:hypothetical protein